MVYEIPTRVRFQLDLTQNCFCGRFTGYDCTVITQMTFIPHG